MVYILKEKRVISLPSYGLREGADEVKKDFVEEPRLTWYKTGRKNVPHLTKQQYISQSDGKLDLTMVTGSILLHRKEKVRLGN